jgi:hypothetical protein
MIFVQSVSRSIDFYTKLGFEVDNVFTPPGQSEPSWAWLESGGASLMVTLASHPVDASQRAVIFCLYCEDVRSFWTALQRSGLKLEKSNILLTTLADNFASRTLTDSIFL